MEDEPTSAGERVVVDAGDTALVLAVADDGGLHQLSFGPGDAVRDVTADFPVGLYPRAYPTFGEEPLREHGLRITHADGVTSTRLVVRSIDQRSIQHGTGENGTEHRIVMADRVAPVAVHLVFVTRPDEGLIDQHVEVVNEGSGTCTLHRAASSALSFAGGDPHLTHWGGGWANEWTETNEPLRPGTKTVASAGGIRPSLHRPPVVLFHPDGPATETSGRVALATIVWAGDTRVDAEVFQHGHGRLLLGAQLEGAERRLGPGDRFVGPVVRWAWSAAGVGPLSRRLHWHVRRDVVRDGDRARAIVANTWEAVFFALGPEVLAAQVDGAAAAGAELFLLDDGWFGTKFGRDDDTAGLGDWRVDRRKLPDGLQPIIDRTLAAGMRFGLWVEPEMVNPASELYEAHPEWVVAEPGRERRTERNQLVLDLLQPAVFDYCLASVDRLLEEHPGISYLKWDANRDLGEVGSTAVEGDVQSHVRIDRVLALGRLMAAVAERHPEVEVMACASGGGRSDLATLQHSHEVWTSDDTDPLDRLRIQWGASHLLPASVLGAHVTRWGDRPIAFGCAVALAGRFGFDLDLRSLTEAEAAVLAESSAVAQRIRHLVQGGDLHRLVSPIGSDRCALAYVAGDGGESVVFAWSTGAGRETGPNGVVDLPGPASEQAAISIEEMTPGRPRRPAVLADGPVRLGGAALPWPAEDAPAARIWLLRRR